jgi:hypothetical protein
MTEKELVKYLTELGVLVTFNKNLKLWQIILDDESFYLSKSAVTTFNKKKLDEFMTVSIVKIMSGNSNKIIYH